MIRGIRVFQIAVVVVWTAAVYAQRTPREGFDERAAPRNFSYAIQEVYFKHPHSFKRSASRVEKAIMAVKVTISGSGFRQAATGPIVWLNGVEADISIVSPDHRVIESFFYRPLQELRKGDRWEVVYAQHRGDMRYTFSDHAMPEVQRLTPAQRKHAAEIGERFGVHTQPEQR